MEFIETQKFPPLLLWSARVITPIVVIFVLSFPVMREFFVGHFVCLILLSVWALLEIVKLDTRIDANGISMTMRPFVSKNIQWEDVERADVIDYGFVGGWGVRYSTRHGTVYNTSGSKGLKLYLKCGEIFVIGTQKEVELECAVSFYHPPT